MNIDPAGKRGLIPLVFVVSCSCLVFELSLLRTFSITLWYHFAFMVISIAMLGIGASGTALSVIPGLKDLRRMPVYALLFSASLPLSYAAANAVPFDPARLAWDSRQLVLIGLYYCSLSIPFFLFGTIMSTAFSLLSGRSSTIYASDLLGAGTGSLAVLLLLSLGGPAQAVSLASLFAAAAVVLVGRGRVRVLAIVLASIDIALLLFHPSFFDPRMSPYKPLPIALSFPRAELTSTAYRPYARIDVFQSPVARFAPGLSLAYSQALPSQTGIAVDGGSIEAFTDSRDPSALRFLEHLPAALPYRLVERGDVLVLDPGGGLAVLTAQRHGARRIDAVESNPLLLQVVRNLDTYSNAAATDARYHTGLGRSWLAASGSRYDIIDIPLSGTMGSATFGFSEDYRYTVEAFRTYLEHLTPAGFLSISHYIVPPPRTELRTLATLAAAAEHHGIADITGHVITIRSWGTITILFSRAPLTSKTIGLARQFCAERRFDMVYYPGIVSGESNRYVRMQDDTYAAAFRQIIDRRSREKFLARYLFDVRPVHDRNPFSRYFLRLENVADTFRVMGGKWQFFFEEGYLLPVLFLQVVVVAFLLLVVPLFTLKRSRPSPAEPHMHTWPWYFAALGLGYLLIEMAYIQITSLVLEHPAYAAGVVIAALLISSGGGSLASHYVPSLRRPRVLLHLAIMTLLYTGLLDLLGSVLLPTSLPTRIIIVFFLLLPAGFLMGIPFPLGMTLLGSRVPDRIPWAWAVNGCFSVFSPILAVMIAITWGYHAVAGVGSALYIVGFLVIRRWDGNEG